MSLLARGIPSSATSNRDGDPWVIPAPQNAGMGRNTSGVTVSPKSSLSHTAVWAAVRILTNTVAGLPLHAIVAGKRLPAEQTPPIIANPFVGFSRRDGIAQIVTSLLMTGNAFCRVVLRDPLTNLPTALQIIAPERVMVRADTDGSLLYTVDGVKVNAADIVHRTGMVWPGERVGLSVISYCARTVGLGIAAEEFGARFFSQGIAMPGVIESAGALSKEDATAMKESFTSAHAGLQNSHVVGVLFGGATYNKIGITPDEAQFLATRGESKLDIAMMFGIPPHMIGQVDKTSSWGTGIEEQTLGFLKYTVKYWTDTLADFFATLAPAAVDAAFDFDDLLKADTSARYTAYGAARLNGFLTTNEIRAKEGMSALPGGDDLGQPLNSAHANAPEYDPATPGSGAPELAPAPQGAPPA